MSGMSSPSEDELDLLPVKPKSNRFTPEQVAILEEAFKNNPKTYATDSLMEKTKLTRKQIYKWIARKRDLLRNAGEVNLKGTRYTKNQHKTLDEFFMKKKYPTKDEFKKLAEETGLKLRQLENTFSYKRFVMRKQIRERNQSPTASSSPLLPPSSQPPLQSPILHSLLTQTINQAPSHPFPSLQQPAQTHYGGLANQMFPILPTHPQVAQIPPPIQMLQIPLYQLLAIQQLQNMLASTIPGLPPVANPLPNGVNGPGQQMP